MSLPETQTPGGGNLLKGNAGIPRKKRTAEGEDYARAILDQDDDDILVTRISEEQADGKVLSTEVESDRHPMAIRNPVIRAVRRQARLGIGNIPGQLPPAVANALADRLYGKPVDRIKLGPGGRPLAGESEEQLRERLREKLTLLEGGKKEVA